MSARRAHLRLIDSSPASDPSPGLERPDPPSGRRELDEDGDRGGWNDSEWVGQLAPDALDDESLVTLTIEGNRHAAEQLYRRHAGFAFNLAVRIAGTSVDVEDVVHDAFLRAYDNLGSLRKRRAFRTWLGSIVVHAMRSRLRRGRLTRLLGLARGNDVVDIDCIVSPQASPAARAELAQVYALLQTLSADDRIAWVLRHVEGHDLQAAAELAGCSLATVKRRIRRAQRFVEAHFVASPQPPAEGSA